MREKSTNRIPHSEQTRRAIGSDGVLPCRTMDVRNSANGNGTSSRGLWNPLLLAQSLHRCISFLRLLRICVKCTLASRSPQFSHFTAHLSLLYPAFPPGKRHAQDNP